MYFYQEALLLPLVDQLCEVVTTTTLTGEITEESAVNGQSAFYSLKLMSRHLGHKNHHTFTKVKTDKFDDTNIWIKSITHF